MSPLVDATVAAMTPLLDRPFAFFGHSMGGLVAFEVIRHLRRIGSKEPVHFFASASPAPHHPDDDPIHHLSDDAILERLSKEGEGYPKEILANPELMEVLLPLARADATVTETHTFVAEDPLACPITAFIAREDHKFTPEQVRDWRSYTRGRFREIVISGGHDFIKTESSTLTRAIADALAV
jgi:medium-chain acyl-[acyl-carrier-protein] hydrolase